MYQTATYNSRSLYPALQSRHGNHENAENSHEANDAKKWPEAFAPSKRHLDVHSKHTADQVERNENRSKHGDLAQHSVRVGTLGDAVDRQGSQVIAVGARQNLFKVTQIGRHGHNVILNVTKVHANVHMWRHLVVFVAALGESAEDVSLAAQESQEGHAILPHPSNRPQERV